MKKRAVSLLLLAGLALLLPGCSAFTKEYLSVTKYEDAAHTAETATVNVSNYAGLKSAVTEFVRGHRTVGRLKFPDYDGVLQTDLTQACQEVKNQDALAAYCVNYISTDLSRVANHYEAVVYISYRHTQSEIDAVRYLSDKSALQEAMGETLSGLDTYASFKLISPSITAGEVKTAAERAFEEDPAICVVQPELAVQIYPETGTLRFVEIELAYGWRTSELQKMKSTLLGRVNQIADDIGAADGAQYVLAARDAVAKSCVYAADGSALGSTAYGAIVSGSADSRGMALAFAALCARDNLECRVVTGTLDGEPHTWNMVFIDGAYYHVDVSESADSGSAAALLRTDKEMSRHYTWDAAAYPACTAEWGAGGYLARPAA